MSQTSTKRFQWIRFQCYRNMDCRHLCSCCTRHCSFPPSQTHSAKAGQHGLTEGLQTGLNELLPAPPFGEGTQGHHGFTGGGLGWMRAGFVEPVRAAWRRNPRPGAASWSHSPLETPTQEKWGGGGDRRAMPFSVCLWGCMLHVFETMIFWDHRLTHMKRSVQLSPESGAIVWM